MNFDFEKHEEYLKVIVKGQYILEEAVSKFKTVLAVCNQFQIYNVVIDYCQAEGYHNAVQKAIYALEVIDIYRTYLENNGKVISIAYVGEPETISSYEPGVDLANSENLPIRLFSSLEDAIIWFEEIAKTSIKVY